VACCGMATPAGRAPVRCTRREKSARATKKAPSGARAGQAIIRGIGAGDKPSGGLPRASARGPKTCAIRGGLSPQAAQYDDCRTHSQDASAPHLASRPAMCAVERHGTCEGRHRLASRFECGTCERNLRFRRRPPSSNLVRRVVAGALRARSATPLSAREPSRRRRHPRRRRVTSPSSSTCAWRSCARSSSQLTSSSTLPSSPFCPPSISGAMQRTTCATP
jgi:hypothetical protein